MGRNLSEGADCGREVGTLSEELLFEKPREKGVEGFLNLSPCLPQVNPFWLVWLAYAEHLGLVLQWMVSSLG